jgi:hypothetical protein
LGVQRRYAAQFQRRGPLVILEQDRQAATVFSRDHGDWAGHAITGDTDLAMPEIGISISLAELYIGVKLAANPPSKQ